MDRESLFTGKERDGETGLDYFGARYLSGAQGRFSSPDPLIGYPSDPQSWNMYAYGRNNPLLYTDPTGMSYEICDTQGNCTKKDLSDSQFNQVRKDNKNQFFSNGKIFNRNDDGSSTQIGTYRRTGDDLPDSGVTVLIGLERRADASNKLIAGVAIGSAVVGVAGGAIAAGAGTAVTQSAMGLGGNIGARLLPLGMTTAYFGQQVMRWGTGNAQALARAGTVTLQEMQSAGITRQMAQSWQQFYSYVAQMNPANPSAAGRAQLMQHVV
jgi:RHS repeat-associated protein